MTYNEFLKAVVAESTNEELIQKAQELIAAGEARKANATAKRHEKSSAKYAEVDERTYAAIVANPGATASKLAEVLEGTTSGATASAKRLLEADRVTRAQVPNGSRLVWTYTAK